LRLAPDWHVYWENSGDSGIPTKIAWTLPPGWSAGDILWPLPERFDNTGLITYGYQGEVMLLVPLSIGPTAAAGRAELKAKVSWLECISEKCVPGSSQVTAQLDIRDSSKASSDRPLIDEWRKKLPESKPADFARAWWDTEGAGESVRGLFIEWSPGPSVQD